MLILQNKLQRAQQTLCKVNKPLLIIKNNNPNKQLPKAIKRGKGYKDLPNQRFPRLSPSHFDPPPPPKPTPIYTPLPPKMLKYNPLKIHFKNPFTGKVFIIKNIVVGLYFQQDMIVKILNEKVEVSVNVKIKKVTD